MLKLWLDIGLLIIFNLSYQTNKQAKGNKKEWEVEKKEKKIRNVRNINWLEFLFTTELKSLVYHRQGYLR